MAESFFNDPETQESPPNEEEDANGGSSNGGNKDIYEFSTENEGLSPYEGGKTSSNNIFHSPTAMVEELRKSFKAGLFDGRLLAQTIIYIFKSQTTTDEDIEEVFELANSLDNDYASAAAATLEFIEQIMFIAQYCHEHESRSYIIPQKLLPLVVKFLKESIPEVRKTSHAALLVLLEQGLVDRRDVEDQVCPVILELTMGSGSPHEYRTEAAALLSKLAPLVGKEVSERIFLDRFAELCSDLVPFVRQVCADNFGDFSSVVGSESTEKILLPKFFQLCKDRVWKIRKSCADEFMPVSCLCSPSVRRKKLSPLFIRLLRDRSQWVKLAAFQSLGPFISTFADPSIKAMLQNFNGEMVIADVEVLAIRLEVLEQKRSMQSPSIDSDDEDEENLEEFLNDDLNSESNETVIGRQNETTSSCSDITSTSETDETFFNSFVYWKTPLPSLDESELPTEIRDFFGDDSRDIGHELRSLMDEDEEDGSNEAESSRNPSQSRKESLVIETVSPYSHEVKKKPSQNIVPQSLVDHFVGMIDPQQSEGIELETAHHCCAFSFPAVALTLGRSNWCLLKNAYNFLANDVQWKVRYTMAASIYELGIILGEEMAGSDLLPFCCEFIKDLDEVRIGILKHLADFIRLLKPGLRRSFLPLISIFLSSYDGLNWRLREELALQIDSMVDIYEPKDVQRSLAPIALILVRDKVSAVRKASLNVLCRILKCFTESSPSNESLCRSLLADLAENLASNKCSWVTRQTYAALSYQILSTRSLDVSTFALYVLPHLLSLSNDRVPNVRIAVARVLVDHICNIDYFNNKANPCHLSVVKTLAILESDSDIDVIQYLASSSISLNHGDEEDMHQQAQQQQQRPEMLHGNGNDATY